MDENLQSPKSRLEALRTRFHARAAGWWRISADRSQLLQVAFCADATMPADVSASFANATRVVSVEATDLGIVKAAISGLVAVSRLNDLSPDAGSGLWLRRFEAERSVAVPVFDEESEVVGVVSLALGDRHDDLTVSLAILETAAEWRDAP